jgi:hypothetical protein
MVFVSCGSTEPEEGMITRMTVDINPSVEFMIDDENKVVSVTALNDDGSILIVGEAFVGKTAEEAVELMLSLATETGYLVKGNAQATENTVKISVSGDSRYAEKLLSDVKKKAGDVLDTLGIDGKVEEIKALGLDALRALALDTSIFSEEEIAAMDETQLCKVIAAGRIETALLLTEDMRNAYFAAKEYEISFARSEEVAKVIESLGGLYTVTHSAYKAALDMYSSAITELDEMRYNLLVSPDSNYQKALLALREAKVDYLEQRTYTASLNVNDEEYASASVTLQVSEENYEKALAAFEKIGNDANKAMESLIAVLRQSEEKLKQLEETMFDKNIEAKLEEKAVEIEEKLNSLKDSFFAEFETAHGEDIAEIESSLLAKKQELIASVDEVQ